jgi:hypothetical protein
VKYDYDDDDDNNNNNHKSVELSATQEATSCAATR